MAETKKVLLVEDQAILLQLMSMELQMAGFDLATASNGLEALKVLEKQPIDVLVTDLYMPEMGGIELIEQMIEQYPDIPVIVLSASRYGDISRQLEAIGVFNFVDKPITAEKISLLLHLIEVL
jgi:two-component system response regulator GlrR